MSPPILRSARALLGPLAATLFSACAAASEAPRQPDFAALEASGAVIGEIRVDTRNIFDLQDRAESGAFYRVINSLHPVTRPYVIERMLLFKSGERVSRQKVEETERLLRALRIIHDVDIRPVPREGGKVVDIEVVTRDSWSLDLTGSFSRSGGSNKSSFGVRERNLLGTGLNIGFGRMSDADRNGTEIEASYNQAFDGWTQLAFTRGRFNDGKRTSAMIDRPFYSLDTRFAARAGWTDDDRIDSIYNAGDKIGEFRHRVKQIDASAGWSAGLVDGITQRYSAGMKAGDDAYREEPGSTLGVALPVDHRERQPYLRYELVEDEFVKVTNYNKIGRAEFVGLGLHLLAEGGPSFSGLDGQGTHWLYSAQAGDGTTLPSGHRLLGQASVERRIGSTAKPVTQGSIDVQLYAPRRADLLYYATVSADSLRGGGVADQLLIGGDEGLRGYPSRYQAGQRRVVGSFEVRWYSDWYPLRLIRVGAAAFVDAGRAWGGPNQNTVNGGWLSDAGVGLRLAFDRTAFANVLHLDIAAPLKRAQGIKSVQFLVKTELNF